MTSNNVVATSIRRQDIATTMIQRCFKVVNPLMPNEISHRHQLEQSLSVLRDFGWYFSFIFKFSKNILQANSGDPVQTLASGLGLHCLPMSHKKDSAHICYVKR